MTDIYENQEHQLSDMESQYAWETTRITVAEIERGRRSQELMEIIQQGIVPLSMQVKRQVLCAIRQREELIRK